MYNWAFNLPPKEKPSDEVIENDERFDVWYNQFVAKRLQEERNSGAGSNHASSHSNVINF